MMSILIKGMEMPKECYDCPVYNSEFCCCNITDTEPWQGHEDDDPVPIPDDCPLIEVQEQKHGKWIEQDGYDGDTYYDCSVCGISWSFLDGGTPEENGTKYCPNCGAQMT